MPSPGAPPEPPTGPAGGAEPAGYPSPLGGRRGPRRRGHRPPPADQAGRRGSDTRPARAAVARNRLSPVLHRPAPPRPDHARALRPRRLRGPHGPRRRARGPAHRRRPLRPPAGAAPRTGRPAPRPKWPSSSTTPTRAGASAPSCSSTWPAAAKDNGISRFVADTLPDNERMLRVFHDAGFGDERTYADGVVRVTFSDRADRGLARRRLRPGAAGGRCLGRTGPPAPQRRRHRRRSPPRRGRPPGAAQPPRRWLCRPCLPRPPEARHVASVRAYPVGPRRARRGRPGRHRRPGRGRPRGGRGVRGQGRRAGWWSSRPASPSAARKGPPRSAGW